MRKTILTLAVVLGTTATFAQDLTSRKGEYYLPEEGDWAIGIDAVPMLNYVGNFFGKTNDNNYAGTIWTPSNPAMVFQGKYFVSSDMAFRGGLRLGFGSNTVREQTANRSDSEPWPTFAPLENSVKSSYSNIGLSFGIEKRKGTTRLQGFYGAEIGFMVSSQKRTFEYGNALTAASANVPVVVTGADQLTGYNNIQADVDGIGTAIDWRELSNKSGLNFSLGLRAFIGAEYFIIPKLSIGGEFGWGLAFNVSGKSSVESETVGALASQTPGNATVQTRTIEGTKESSFGFDNSNFNPLFGGVARLNLTFHF